MGPIIKTEKPFLQIICLHMPTKISIINKSFWKD